jgi:hypothetical protein
MNSIIEQSYPLFELYQALRNQLMEMLVDEDLAFKISAELPTLGALCKEIGEIEQSYIDSFQTFTQDFSYRYPDDSIETSCAALVAWYKSLDDNLKVTVTGLSEADIADRVIDRGGGFTVSPRIQLEIYKEALLIFYGKVSVYLKAMGKVAPEQWQDWIG